MARIRRHAQRRRGAPLSLRALLGRAPIGQFFGFILFLIFIASVIGSCSQEDLGLFIVLR